MTARRKDDKPGQQRTYFRTERVVEDGGRWYFLTREGKLEGPFETRRDANDRAEVYARIKDMRLLAEDREQELHLL